MTTALAIVGCLLAALGAGALVVWARGRAEGQRAQLVDDAAATEKSADAAAVKAEASETKAADERLEAAKAKGTLAWVNERFGGGAK